VTGGSNGIGRALALRLARYRRTRGHLGRQQSDADEAFAVLRKNGGPAEPSSPMSPSLPTRQIKSQPLEKPR